MSVLEIVHFRRNFVSILLVIVLFTCESECLSEKEILSNLRPLKNVLVKESCKTLCNNIVCETIKECKIGTIEKKASYCNCCDACVKYLDIGERCKNATEGSLALGIQERCMPGTKCNISNQCTVDRDIKRSCPKLREIRTQIKGILNYTEDIWIPQCDREGKFIAKQRKTLKSICVDEFGDNIFGSAEDSLNNTCYCSRHVLKESKKDTTNYKPQEHCTAEGSFDTLQCISNLCYCADPNTGHVNSSSLVRIDFLHELPCYDKKRHKEGYLKDCETKLQRTRKIANELKQKNINLDSIDTVKCDPDGSFGPVQRHENQYKCTDKNGNGIGSYKKDIAEDVSLEMTCNCAREISRDFVSATTCLGDGSYRKVTCINSECFCLDQDGSRISKGMGQSDDINSFNSFCKKLTDDSFEYPVSNNDNDDTDHKETETYFTDDDYER